MRIRLRSRQRGVTLGGLLVVVFIVVIVGIMSLKLIPGYIEYAKAKAAIEAVLLPQGISALRERRPLR